MASSTVARIDAYHVVCRLPAPVGNALRTFGNRSAVLVAVTTRGGVVGWGETWGLPAATFGLLRHVFAPALVGADVAAPNAVWRRLAALLVNDRRGTSHMALSALDIAVWDAAARHDGVPLARKLGGALRDRLSAYASGPFVKPGPEPCAHFPDEVAGYVARGFRAVKVRLGLDPDRDAVLLRDLHARLGPDILLAVDWNEAGTVRDAQRFGALLADVPVAWLEEPVRHDDLPGWTRLAAATPLALAGGESLYGAAGFRDHLAAGVFDIVQPDLALCGGLSEGLRIAALAEAFERPVMPHVWGTAVNFHASAHFAAVLPDRIGTARRLPFFEHDASDNPLRAALTDLTVEPDGTVPVPDGPGIGLDLTPEQLAPFVVEHWSLH